LKNNDAHRASVEKNRGMINRKGLFKFEKNAYSTVNMRKANIHLLKRTFISKEIYAQEETIRVVTH
jgi:hypothetical protein